MSRNTAQLKPPCTLTKVILRLNNRLLELEALIDSGAEESFMNWHIARENQLEVKKLTHPINASALNGQFIFQATHSTEPCEMTIDANHQETISRISATLPHSGLSLAPE